MSKADAIKTLAATRAALDQARAELRRIGEVLQVKDKILSSESAEAAVAEADAALQDALAAQALGEADDAVVAAAVKKLDRAERDLATCQSAANAHRQLQAGAERRLNEAHQAVTDAQEAYQLAQAHFVLAELEAADARYVKAAGELMQSAGRVLTCAAFLKKHAPSLLPAASASRLDLPPLPTIGPASARAVYERTEGREHGIRQALTDPRYLRIDTAALETELEFSSYPRPLAA